MKRFYYAISEGVRVTVRPLYLPAHSSPDRQRFVFAYHVRLENVGAAAARLLWRHWEIHDPLRGDSIVEGEGVIGEQPLLEPGGVHEYQSFCVLGAPGGWMRGHYLFERGDGERFRVRIPRFALGTEHA